MDRISDTFCKTVLNHFSDIAHGKVSNFGGRSQLYRLVTKTRPMLEQEEMLLCQSIDLLVDKMKQGGLTIEEAAGHFLRTVEVLFNPETRPTSH